MRYVIETPMVRGARYFRGGQHVRWVKDKALAQHFESKLGALAVLYDAPDARNARVVEVGA